MDPDDSDSLLRDAQFLKENQLIQGQVQEQLRWLKGKHRDTGRKNFKTGLLRVCESKKKVEVAWPHDFCYLGHNGKSPQYENLSPFQFVFGHIGCIQDETNQQVKDNMLEYLKLLKMDAIETNWATVKRAHSVLLKTMERGRCNWGEFENVDKIRMRCIQRTLQTYQSHTGGKNSGSNTKREAVCIRYNANTCLHTQDHVEGTTLYKHACAHCHLVTKRFFGHKQSDCNRLQKNGEKKETKNSN